MSRTRLLRLAAAVAATLLLLGPLAWFWLDSRMPSAYNVAEMGRADDGGGPVTHHHGPAGGGRSVDALTADPRRVPDVDVTLTARKERFALASGRKVDGYTLNGVSPGPPIEAVQGQLVQVRLVNASVPDGVTLHWHGLDVPNAADGVAGITQDAVPVGGEHLYRFVADQAGTFWYHSHQVSHEQVAGGMLGAVVIHTAGTQAAEPVDVTVLTHLYDGVRTLNGAEADTRVQAAPGARVRVRVINTDNGPTSVWVSGAPAAVAAVDGTDLHGPSEFTGKAVVLTAGGRIDFALTMPAGGGAVRVQIGGPLSVVLGNGSADVPPTRQPDAELDLLSYGTPAPLGFDPTRPDRAFQYAIGRRPGFVDGRPGFFWTINGRLFPDVPMFMVAEGDVVRMTIANRSGEVHPMHLHGHHAVVLSRDGVPASGSPWWVDSLDVGDGETYEIAFVADNPGVWADHCHNLKHAREGLLAHLMYEGVTSPYLIGGHAHNTPE